MKGILIKLEESLKQLTPSERKAAQYILEHPEEVLNQTVAELSQKSGASQAAIIRLCKSLNIEGYPELKLKVAADFYQNEIRGYKDVSRDDSVKTMIQSVINNTIHSIHETATLIDEEEIINAVQALSHAEKIHFYGVGASNLVAQDAQRKFLRINKLCMSFNDHHLQVACASSLTEKDVAVAISYSGKTPEVALALKHAKQAGATTISITNSGDCELNTYADISLYVASTQSNIKAGATTSRISQMIIIDVLFHGVLNLTFDQSIMYLEKSRQAVRELTGGGRYND